MNNNVNNMELITQIFPSHISKFLLGIKLPISNVYLNVGNRLMVLAGSKGYKYDHIVTREDIETVEQAIASINGGELSFGSNCRAGIRHTFHRVSVNDPKDIRNLNVRFGAPIDVKDLVIADLVESRKRILIMGVPGAGKTTMLRAAAMYLANNMNLIAVYAIASDTEFIGYDMHHVMGDVIPWSGDTNEQANNTNQITASFSPIAMCVDEMANAQERNAVIAALERGRTVIASIHGSSLNDAIHSELFGMAFGGVKETTMGDAQANAYFNGKKVGEEQKRRSPFDYMVHVISPKICVVYDLHATVNRSLVNDPRDPAYCEIRSPYIKGEKQVVLVNDVQKHIDTLVAYEASIEELIEREATIATKVSVVAPAPAKKRNENTRMIYLDGVSVNQMAGWLKDIKTSYPIIVTPNIGEANLVIVSPSVIAQGKKFGSKAVYTANAKLPEILPSLLEMAI